VSTEPEPNAAEPEPQAEPAAAEPEPEPAAPIELPEPSEMSSVQFLPLNLNDATFEQLRDVGLSVTQTGRVLAHRERSGRFGSVDELEGIPGFPRDFLEQIKSRLTV
jgi:competence protein ComEA